MKTPIVLLAAAMAAFPCTTQARIGETKEECIARYGAPTGTSAARLKKSEGEADVFALKEMQVIVEYRDGKAWYITYMGRRLGKDDAERLLAKNAEGAKWKDSEFLGTTHWNENDRGLHAVFFRDPRTRLTIFKHAAFASDWNPRVSFFDATAEAAEPAASEETKTSKERDAGSSSDPLDGF